jgi:hypothetical protein
MASGEVRSAVRSSVSVHLLTAQPWSLPDGPGATCCSASAKGYTTGEIASELGVTVGAAKPACLRRIRVHAAALRSATRRGSSPVSPGSLGGGPGCQTDGAIEKSRTDSESAHARPRTTSIASSRRFGFSSDGMSEWVTTPCIRETWFRDVRRGLPSGGRAPPAQLPPTAFAQRTVRPPG